MSASIKPYQNVWTNVYGVSRSILALGTLLTLLFHNADILFEPTGIILADLTANIWLTKISLFNIVPKEHLEIARWSAIFFLTLIISGWRPRITGVLHWWISFSFAVSCFIPEGGDQITAILTLLLLPVTLTDRRRWHWKQPENESISLSRQIQYLIAISCFFIIRIQIAIIYFWASTSKLYVREWANGTALYYWFTHPIFGMPEWLDPVFMPVITNSYLVTLFTWGVVLLEIILFMGLLMNRRWRPLLLKVGLLFHFGIMIIHGLVSFFCAMAGALILYLRAHEREFTMPFKLKRVFGHFSFKHVYFNLKSYQND